MIPALVLALQTLASDPLPEPQEGIEALRVGHWIEARGAFEGERFVASKVELLVPHEHELLIGTVPEGERDPDRFRLLGQPVHVSERTEWEGGLEPGELAGRRIQVEGRWQGPGKLAARDVEPREEGRERIGGRIDALERVAGGVEARVMRYVVFLPDGVELELEKPLSEIPLAPPREVTAFEDSPSELEVEFGLDDDRLGPGIALADGLVLEGLAELQSLFEEEYDLDREDEEDRRDLRASGRLRLAWTPRETFAGVAELRYSETWRDDDEDGRSSEGDGELGETYLHWSGLAGGSLDLVAGRQDFDDPREWIYDQNLDGVRAFWDLGGALVELSGSTTLADGSARDGESTNWIAYVSNGVKKRHLAAWALYKDVGLHGQEERDLWIGARALGKWLPGTKLWLDGAWLTGERGSTDLAAWGYDAGATWAPDFLGPLSFTLGYALGTGDDSPGDGDDGTFRQTGYNDNTAKFDGVTSFQYYGELADPELANLGIFTAGVGLRLGEDTSLDLVYHRYTQDVPAPIFFDTDVDPDPNGLDADLGQELDLVFGCRTWEHFDLEIVGAAFDPGDGFDEEDEAYFAKVQLRYRF
jgi:alginate production protein